jgi:plastocyanin
MRTKLVLLAAAAATAITLLFVTSPQSGGSSRGASAAATKSVSVRDNSFSPRAANIERGDKVVWRWKGSSPHNVRFRKVPKGAKRPKGSETQDSGRFARTFSKRGTFRYVCTIHEDLGMKGRVVVE